MWWDQLNSGTKSPINHGKQESLLPDPTQPPLDNASTRYCAFPTMPHIQHADEPPRTPAWLLICISCCVRNVA